MGDDGTARYRAVFTDPTAWRIWTAATISYFGDFVGLGALLLAGYDPLRRAPAGIGRRLRDPGGAGVCGLGGHRALAGPHPAPRWPDRAEPPGRRSGFAADHVFRAVVRARRGGRHRRDQDRLQLDAGPAPSPTACRGPSAGASSPWSRRPTRCPRSSATSPGSSVAIAIGTGTALAADAVTFVIAAALLAGLRLPTPSRSRHRASMTTGIRTIFGDRTLALLVPVAWIGLSLGAVPQSLAAAALKAERGWVPVGPGGDGGRRGHLRHGGRPDRAERADPRPVRLHGRERRRLHAHRRRHARGPAAAWWPGTSWSASPSAGPWRRRPPSFTSYLSSGWRTSPAR